jgi:hypothetical protein
MTDTPETTRRPRAAWEDVAVLAIGAWLTFSPPSLEINGSIVDTATTVIAGVVLMLFGGGSMRSNEAWLEWTIMVTGAALATAPWVVGFELKTAIINATACGIAVIALSAWRVFDLRAKKAAKAVPERPRQAA